MFSFDIDTVDYKVVAKDDSVELLVYLPGVKKENISVELDSYLTVKAKDRVGYSKWSFERSWRLGDGIDVEKISSSLVDGVLSIILPIQKQVSQEKYGLTDFFQIAILEHGLDSSGPFLFGEKYEMLDEV